MHVYLISMGSLGDTLPFVYVGEALLRRGHRVTLLGNEHYQTLIESRGLSFEPILTRDRYLRFIDNRESGPEKESIADMARLVVEQVEPVYRLLVDRFVPGETVVAAQAYAMGARLAQEIGGVPLATCHLQPMWFRSSIDMPQVPGWFPRWLKSGLQGLGDVVFDAAIGKGVMAFRKTLGKAPVKRVMRDWWNSPQKIIGLFPDWFSPRQVDWPEPTELVGFPLPDATDPSFDPSAVDAFLDAGPPPLVVSQSSIASDTKAFFHTSISVARSLGLRTIFLTSMRELLPDPLPEGMIHFPFVPLDHLLPRSRAHIHHGGIGTIAQTIRAGIPQMTVAKIYDQPDNSVRLERLGISRNINPKRYQAEKVTKQLESLIQSEDVARRCRDFANRMAQENGLERACGAIESLLHAPSN